MDKEMVYKYWLTLKYSSLPGYGDVRIGRRLQRYIGNEWCKEIANNPLPELWLCHGRVS